LNKGAVREWNQDLRFRVAIPLGCWRINLDREGVKPLN
jgi:hypothetical protein